MFHTSPALVLVAQRTTHLRAKLPMAPAASSNNQGLRDRLGSNVATMTITCRDLRNEVVKLMVSVCVYGGGRKGEEVEKGEGKEEIKGR